MSEPDGRKGLRYLNFNHGLFEVVIDLEQERGRWLLLVKHLETVSMLFQGAKQDYIKYLEDMSCVSGKCDDSHSGMGEDRNNVIRDVR
jgi:hypothetical protein